MTLGATFVKAHQLRPGIALSAEQVAALTSDIVWLPVAGAGAAAANTTFNNFYHGEDTSVWAAAGLGAVFGKLGPQLGMAVQKSIAPVITNTPKIPVAGPTYIPAQSRLPHVPKYVGNAVNNTVSNLPSFMPLDNGKKPQGSAP